MKPSSRTKYRIIHADVLKYLRDYQPVVQRGFMPKYHAILADAPYFLGSIVKRFGKAGAAEAVEGKDGAFRRLSKGFMGQTWDGFKSPQDYQAWVTAWGTLLLDFVYPGAVLAMFGGSRTYHRLVCGLEDAGWEIYDSISNWTYASGFPKNHKLGNGYGTALKPANEPIVIARAPRKKLTYQYCFDTFGTSGLAIDACRIAHDEVLSFGNGTARHNGQMAGGGQTSHYRGEWSSTEGRYPANFILNHHPECNGLCHPDCHVRALGEQSGERKSGSSLSGAEPSSAGGKNVLGRWNRIPFEAYEDEGTAARFFYQAKPASWERDAGLDDFDKVQSRTTYDKANRDGHGNDSGRPRSNTHPTVKSIQLAEYISRLISPPLQASPRRLLIPFSGSGSEMIGAFLSGGFEQITGIELTAEYIPIAQARLAWWTKFDSYAMAEAHYKKQNPDQMTLFEAM